jgi:hypothetical protein
MLGLPYLHLNLSLYMQNNTSEKKKKIEPGQYFTF